MSKTLINIAHKNDRTVVLVDMDCFYCQVEEKLEPSLKGSFILETEVGLRELISGYDFR